jgi:hypothetical protein
MRTRVFYAVLAALLALGLLAGVASADDGGRPFATNLTGAAEIPAPGDPDGTGTATLTVNPGQGEICYTLTVTGVTPVAAAHIHAIGPLGFGPVVVPLVPPTAGTSSGCASVSRDLAKAILQHPEQYYVNVHNADYPAGALRGNLGK